jgi:hypothetical protein
MTEIKTYRVPTQNLQFVHDKLAEINKTAAKIGCEPVRVVEVGREYEERKNAAGVKHTIEFVLFVLEGTTPKFAGWHLVAVIEMLGEERLVKNVPGQEYPVSYRQGQMSCDYCGHERNRKEVFVLKHESGEYRQVGRSCMKDFLGGTSPEGVLSWAELILSLDGTCGEAQDEGFGWGGCRYSPSIAEYLAVVAICIRRIGWVSAKMAQESFEGKMSTSYLAWRVCTESNNKHVAEMIREHNLIAEYRDIELTDKVLAWAKALPTDAGDYLYNLGVACRSGICNFKTIGLIASSVSAYQREQDRIEELNIKAREPRLNEYIGEIKERRGFVVTVKSLRGFDSDFGVRTLVNMRDAEGRTLTWWKSGEADWLEEGKQYEITGTIKKHDEYKGWKQTVLQRVTPGLPAPKKAKKKAA